ncbi:hypothetical protein L9F63_020331, partial [Diploptera punctata]
TASGILKGCLRGCQMQSLAKRRGTTSLTTTAYSPKIFFSLKTTLEDARRNAVSGETSANYKPHDHGLQPENLLQDHHSNSGRE